MNDQQSEFEKWWEDQHISSQENDVLPVQMPLAIHLEKNFRIATQEAWNAACAHSQKEIDDLKQELDLSVKLRVQVEKEAELEIEAIKKQAYEAACAHSQKRIDNSEACVRRLRDIMQYLYDTDELGQEYLCDRAKAHYNAAQQALDAYDAQVDKSRSSESRGDDTKTAELSTPAVEDSREGAD